MINDRSHPEGAEETLKTVRAIPHSIIHFAYSRPREEDSGHYYSAGYGNAKLVQSLVMQDAESIIANA